ncbi:MAG: hypothetical protein ABW208_09430 [Pyrinomonadaceae bacterium]
MSREFDDFVARLVPDPTDSPDLLLLSGYLGVSSEEGHVRLYQDEELSCYVEIPREAVRRAQALTTEQSPLGGSLVWVERKAELMHGRAGAEPGAASFLEGWLEDEYTEVTAAFGGGGAGQQVARPAARGAGPGGGIYPSVPCITPLISRRIPCRPPENPFIRQHYQDFLNRPPDTRFWCR